jgi:hypothetical protein
LSTGLTTGIYEDTTSFLIESRDAFGNKVFLGPMREVQVVEVYNNATQNLTGSFSLSFGGFTVAIAAKANLDVFQAAVEKLHVGAVDVSTTSATTPTALVAQVIEGSAAVSFNLDPSTIFKVGDWIRLVDSTSGPVFSISLIDSPNKVITLSKAYPGVTASTTNVFFQPNASYQYIITFDSEMGDIPALVIDVSGLSGSGVTPAYGAVIACDNLITQRIITATSTILGGTFYLSIAGSRTPDLAYNVSAVEMTAALESLNGVYAVIVAKLGGLAGVNSYAWDITFTGYDDSILPAQIIVEGGLLTGVRSFVSVDTNFCPSATVLTGTAVASVSGSVGETFFAELNGETKVGAAVTYVGQGVYQATYLTPREGHYNLTIAKADKGGLLGVYFNNRWLFGEPSFSRIDSFLSFNWSANDTLTPTGRDYISIRWTGYLLPAFSEIYTFEITVDDGARIWIDDILLMDEFNNTVADGASPAIFNVSTIQPLHANQLVSIKIEYRESKSQ